MSAAFLKTPRLLIRKLKELIELIEGGCSNTYKN
jgi:hypothetical protein